MSKKTSKAAKNGFYYFMLDFKAKEQRQGKNYGNMSTVAEAAGPLWKNMTKEERQPYDLQAKKDKGTVKKYTSQGVDVEVIKRKEQVAKQKELNMKDDIQQTVSFAKNTRTLPDLSFYIIHINDFCLCVNERYYLAEIALSRFSLKEGVKDEDVFHAIVKPGPIPLGYSYQARKTSAESHQLPPPDQDDPSNIEEVFLNFVDHLAAGKKTTGDKLPPLYVKPAEMEKINKILQQLCIDYGFPEDTFKVYDLAYLFFKLRNACFEDSFPYLSIANLEIEKDLYDYAKDIACQFHEETDAINFCSRSHVIRLAFIICDACCSYLDIDLIPGQHIPYKSDLSRAVSQMSYAAPSATPLQNYASSDRFSVKSSNSTLHAVRTSSFDRRHGQQGSSSNSSIKSSEERPGTSIHSPYEDDTLSIPESLAHSTADNFEDFIALGGDCQEDDEGAWQSVGPAKPNKNNFAVGTPGCDLSDGIKAVTLGKGRARGVAVRGSVLKFRYGRTSDTAVTLRSATKLNTEWNGPKAMPAVLQQSSTSSEYENGASNFWSNPEREGTPGNEHFPPLGATSRPFYGRGRGRGNAKSP